jgi:hypothetical protein
MGVKGRSPCINECSMRVKERSLRVNECIDACKGKD